MLEPYGNGFFIHCFKYGNRQPGFGQSLEFL